LHELTRCTTLHFSVIEISNGNLSKRPWFFQTLTIIRNRRIICAANSATYYAGPKAKLMVVQNSEKLDLSDFELASIPEEVFELQNQCELA